MSSDAGVAGREDEVRILQDSVQAFAQRELPLTRARRLRETHPDFEPAMFRTFAEQGWTGLLLPPELDGMGLGFAEMRAVVAELSAALAAEPFVPSAVLAAGLLRRAPAGATRDSLARGLAAGASIPVVAASAQAPSLVATAAAGGWRVSGDVRFVRPGEGATDWLLPARIGDDVAVFRIPARTSGLELKCERTAAGGTVAHLRCQDLAVKAEDCLGDRLGAGFEAARDEALVMHAVELLAMVRRMRAMTMEYLANRNQFGRPIGSFQVLQHRAVDLMIHEELTAAVIGQAVAGLDANVGANARASLASRAKARAAETAILVTREAIQMHGAIGTTDEYDLGLYVNRVLSLVPWLGNAAHHRQRFVKLNPLGTGEY